MRGIEMTVGAISDFRVLVVPGLHGSDSDHWQTRWQKLYPWFERVNQADWHRPKIDAWSERLGQALRRSTQPALIVAHSFGCLTAVHCIAGGAPSVAGVLLVAPADPEKFGVAEALRNAVLSCPSIVIGSANDPWMEAQRASDWARRWGSDFVDAGALGHINAESGLGDWRSGIVHLKQLAALAGTSFQHDLHDSAHAMQ